MAKRSNLTASFLIAEQPILEVSTPASVPQPKETPKPIPKDHRANRQAFTVWLDRDLVARIRGLSRDLVTEHGRPGNSIEALVTEGLEHVLGKHRRS